MRHHFKEKIILSRHVIVSETEKTNVSLSKIVKLSINLTDYFFLSAAILMVDKSSRSTHFILMIVINHFINKCPASTLSCTRNNF